MRISLCVLLLALLALSSQIQLESFRSFFKSTFDKDDDNNVELKDWVEHFVHMQPDLSFNQSHLQETFDYYDVDGNGRVVIEEMLQQMSLSLSTSIVIKQKFGPKQLHLGLTGKDNQMQIMWVTKPDKANKPIVEYGLSLISLNNSRNASWTEYNVGHYGFHGRIYRAVMDGLISGRRYYYKVGDHSSGYFSEVKSFIAPPLKSQHVDRINIAVFGDMGTFAPFGFEVSHLINTTHMIDPFDFVFLTGDISYAGMNSEKRGETEPIWDLFGELCEKWAAYTPFMPGVGNHQKYYNYTAYRQRYYLPRSEGSGQNFWFSFDYGQLHIIHISSQHPYTKGSPQYAFIQMDLQRASKNPNTQWIILGAHRPFYCSSTMEYNARTPLIVALEDLLNKYHVDIVQTGHVHSYQRTWPMYYNTPKKQGQNITHYIKPTAPVYVVQGTAGALMGNKWISPTPQWSAVRGATYGFGRIQIRGNSLKYQYISTGGKVLDEWHIIK